MFGSKVMAEMLIRPRSK